MQKKWSLPLGSVMAIAAGAVAFMAVSASDASATHWRGGNISWTDGAAANEVNFTFTSYWRRTAFGGSAGDGFGAIGDTVSFGDFFNFGDGGSVAGAGVISATNVSDNWIKVTQTVSHTYNSAGPFTASWQSCCRISTLQNNADGNNRVESIVRANGSSSPNEGSSSPIFEVADGGVRVFNPFTTTDPDGGTFTYALASSAQAGPGFNQPTALSIDALTGNVTWDTDAAGTAVGQLWSVSFIVTDNTGNTAPLDILLSICSETRAGCGGFVPPDPVPEPATFAVLGLGLLGVAAGVRRRRS
jgi:hypothetical protein